VNDANILGLANNDILFQVHNIGKMIYNVERNDDVDQYSNDRLSKYKKMIEDLRSHSIMVVCVTPLLSL
jgi:hypothetical protein